MLRLKLSLISLHQRSPDHPKNICICVSLKCVLCQPVMQKPCSRSSGDKFVFQCNSCPAHLGHDEKKQLNTFKGFSPKVYVSCVHVKKTCLTSLLSLGSSLQHPWGYTENIINIAGSLSRDVCCRLWLQHFWLELKTAWKLFLILVLDAIFHSKTVRRYRCNQGNNFNSRDWASLLLFFCVGLKKSST